MEQQRVERSSIWLRFRRSFPLSASLDASLPGLRVLCIFLIALALATPSIQSARFEGRLNSELYFWTEDERDHIRPYQSLSSRFLIYQTDRQHQISFNSYVKWTTDFSDKLATDPRTSVYNAYLHLSNFPENFDLKLGRQFVYTSVGAGSINGLKLNYRWRDRIEFEMFGGSAVSRLNSDKVYSLSDRALVGSRFTVKASRSTKFGLHWMLHRWDGTLAYHRFGMDANQNVGNFRLYGRAALDHEDARPSELLGRVSIHKGRHYFSAEFAYRQPRVRANSLFSLFSRESYQRLRVEARRKISNSYYLTARVSAGLFYDRDSWRGSVGIWSERLDLSLYHQSGFGGDNYGLNGRYYLPEHRGWRSYTGVGLNRYRVQSEQEDRSSAHSVILGVQRELGKRFDMLAECQYLSDAVTESGLRLLLRVTKRFSLGNSTGGGE